MSISFEAHAADFDCRMAEEPARSIGTSLAKTCESLTLPYDSSMPHAMVVPTQSRYITLHAVIGFSTIDGGMGSIRVSHFGQTISRLAERGFLNWRKHSKSFWSRL